MPKSQTKNQSQQPTNPVSDEGNLNQIQELENRLKRALADYQNLEKRVASEKQTFVKFANSTLISNLLPVLDILEKAAFHSQDPGVKMAVDQFRQALFLEGLEEINPKPGLPFDHEALECIEVIEGKPEQNNTISEVLAKGYRFKDGLVLKPAKVTVFKSEIQNSKSQINSRN